MRLVGRLSRRAVAVLAVMACALLVGLTTTLSGVWTGLENGSIDARFALRGAVRPSDVVVVGVDDATLNRLTANGYPLQWPFPRRLDAQAIDRLKADGARAIVYDVQFTEPTDPRNDLALYHAVAHARNVVLATSETDAGGHTDVLGGDANVASAHARVGAANLVTDATGVYREYPFAVNGLGSLAVVAAARAGRPVQARSFSSDAALIDFRGPPGTVREVPFWLLVRAWHRARGSPARWLSLASRLPRSATCIRHLSAQAR